MALTVTKAGTGTNSGTAGTSLAFNCGTTFNPGDLLIVAIACDNSGTSGASSVQTPTDVKSHTYVQDGIKTFSPGSVARDGATVAVYSTVVLQSMVATDQVTISSSSSAFMAATVYKVVSSTGQQIIKNAATTTGTAANSNAPTVTTESMTSGWLVIGAAAVETDDAITGDSDTTNGSWSTVSTVLSDGGADASTMSSVSQAKVVTGSGTQTYNISWTTARDTTIIAVTYKEDINATIARAAIATVAAVPAPTLGAGWTTSPSAIATVAAQPAVTASVIDPPDLTNSSVRWRLKMLQVQSQGPFLKHPTGIDDAENRLWGLGLTQAPSAGDGSAAPTAIAVVAAQPAVTATGQSSATATPAAIAAVALPKPVNAFTHVYATSVSGNGRYLLDNASQPIMLSGVSPQIVASLTTAQMDTVIGKLTGIGINAVLSLGSTNETSWGTGTNGANVNGDLPWTGAGSTNDITSPNDNFWDHIEAWIDKCASAGITVVMNLIDDIKWGTMIGGKSDADCRSFGQAMGTRFASKPNIIWSFGIDYGIGDWGRNSKYASILRGLRDNGANQMFTLWGENNISTDNTDWDGTTDRDPGAGTWYWPVPSINFVYQYYSSEASIKRAWQDAAIPAGFFESNYLNEHWVNTDGVTTTTRKAMRKQTGRAITFGGFVGAFPSSADIWMCSWSGISTDLDDVVFRDCSRIINHVRSLTNWHLLVPDYDDSFITSTNVCPTEETKDADTHTYTTCSVASNGALAVAYVTKTGDTYDLTELTAGLASHYWYDPTNNTTSSVSTGQPTYPGNNSAGDSDWLLVFTAAPANATATPATIATAAVPQTVNAGGSATTAPAAISIVAAQPAVTASGATNTTATPATIALAVVPELGYPSADCTVAPSAVATVAALPAVAATGTGSATATPAAIAVVAAQPAATTTYSGMASPAAIAAVAAPQAPTLAAGSTVTPAAVATTIAQPAVTTSGTGTSTPAAIASVAAFPAVAAFGTGSATASPATIASVAAFPAVTATGGLSATAAPSAIATVAAAQTVTASGTVSATATPAAIAAVAAPQAPGATGGSDTTAAPGAIAVVAAFPAVTASASENASTSPAAITVVADIPFPWVTGTSNATATPATIATRAVPNAVIAATAVTISVAVITALASPQTPTVANGTTTSPATIAAVALPLGVFAVGSEGFSNPPPVALTAAFPGVVTVVSTITMELNCAFSATAPTCALTSRLA